jgi:hypothetical protein
MTEEDRGLTAHGVAVRTAVLLLWAYYLLYGLVAPPVVTDAHFYELARLYVIRQGGLLHNDVFAHFEQIAFPWTFDAIHWPLVRVGFGYALPSYACFTGILVVAFLAVRDEYDAEVAWLCLLAFFAMPTLIYQATSTKADIAIAFGFFCWFHAMRRFGRDGRRSDLAWSALAIAFSGGAKTAGLPVAALLAGASVWALRQRRRELVFWLGCLAGAGVLFLSIETYVASARTFGDFLGPGGLRMLRNNDGLAGAAANLVRHVAYNVDIGADVIAEHKWVVSSTMERLCRRGLAHVGLANRGYAAGESDATLDFIKAGHEAQDGFGPLGTIALVVVPLVLLRGRSTDWPWRLGATAVGLLALLSYTIGFGLWVNRFLLLPFALGTLATVLYLARAWRRSMLVRGVGLAVLFYAAFVLPAVSFNRKPEDLWLSIQDRGVMLTAEMPANLPVLHAVQAELASCPSGRWIVTSHPLAAQFLFYDLLRDREIIARPRQVTLAFLAEVERARPGSAVRVLALNQDLPRLAGLVELRSFEGEFPGRPMTRIYRYGQGSCEG